VAIEGRYLDKDEKIDMGSMVVLPRHHARVLACVISPEVRSPPVVPAAPIDQESNLKKWKITYSTLKDLDHGRMKAYDGFVEFYVKNSSVIRKNTKGAQIGFKRLERNDCFSLSLKIRFRFQMVRIGMCIFEP
jgi:hypothetical protein